MSTKNTICISQRLKKTLQISKCDIIKGSFRSHAYFGSCLQNSETTLIVTSTIRVKIIVFMSDMFFVARHSMTSTKTMNRILGKHFFRAGFILQAKGKFTSTQSNTCFLLYFIVYLDYKKIGNKGGFCVVLFCRELGVNSCNS